MQGREGFRRTIRTLKDRTFVACQNHGKSHEDGSTLSFQRYHLKLVVHRRWDLLKKYICEHKHPWQVAVKLGMFTATYCTFVFKSRTRAVCSALVRDLPYLIMARPTTHAHCPLQHGIRGVVAVEGMVVLECVRRRSTHSPRKR